jgi:hypothetical protein
MLCNFTCNLHYLRDHYVHTSVILPTAPGFCVDSSVHLSGGKYRSMDGSCILLTSYSSSSGSSSLPRLPLLGSGTAVALILHPRL